MYFQTGQSFKYTERVKKNVLGKETKIKQVETMFLQGFIHSRSQVVSRISEPSTVS